MLLTIDTEPDWGYEGWRALAEVLPRFLNWLEERGVRATFFVVGHALDAPEARAALAGIGPMHEVGSHGLTHRPLDTMSPDEVREELKTSKARLEDFFQRPVSGVRAPFFRPPSSGWLDVVRESGYTYESSFGSIWPGPANTPFDRWRPLFVDGVWRLPITTFRDRCTPLCLTYLRVAPFWFSRLVPRSAPMFYLHLHEFLPPGTAERLRIPLRWILRRNAGAPAWRLMDEFLRRADAAAPARTCAEFLAGYSGAE